MSLFLLGLGTAIPRNIISQEDSIQLTQQLCCSSPGQMQRIPELIQQMGIATRHIVLGPQVIRDVLDGTNYSNSAFVPRQGHTPAGPSTGERQRLYDEHAAPLAQQAAERALVAAGTLPREITHLVTVSCTGFQAPGVDIALIQGLGLPATTQRTHVGYMGCHGALNGLRVARGLVGLEQDARVLLCAVELCSLHFQYEESAEHVIANGIFSDGAAAIVGSSSGDPDDWTLRASGSCLLPRSTNAMRWTITDQGYQMTLSRDVPDLIQKHLPSWLEGWLQSHQRSIGDIRSWAIHPGGPKILAAVQTALDLPAQAMQPAWEIYVNHGNMSSPTIVFLLQYLQQCMAPRPCVAMGFGPGLTVEAALFE